ncbi:MULTISPECIES: hypothetical protein [unclassified Sphingobium]|jgi:hypothetical protein|uniref:hypothetical protein n=1 Tax=unclassified Sphingobium TaxID=2611147 RepID=UPI000ADAEDC5|nr:MULTISPECIES: hypothetical protein [unclassified Sphingobium]
MKMLRNAALGMALIASMPISATPAEARDHYRHYSRHYDNDAAVALSAGIVGLAIGAAIASDRPRSYYDDDYYYRERYYHPHYRSYYYYDSYPRYYDRRWYRYNDHHWRHHHHDDDDDD